MSAPDDYSPSGLKRNTHLLDWLADGHTHCKHGSKEWCEAYLHNARDTILSQDEALASSQEEIARLRKALEDAEDTLQLVERPAFLDPAHGDEIDRLGRRIGFGALMSSASASWRAYLLASGCPAGGEFVAGPCHGTVVATLARIRAARALASQPVPEHGGE